MGGSTRVTWRGATFDSRTRDMLVELDRIMGGNVIEVGQGSYSGGVEASGGTHDGGGAVDIRASNLTDAQERQVVLYGRRIGFAMWLRAELWRGKVRVWPEHIHGIAIGCPDLSRAARDQVVDYRNGRNGLAGNGPDDGPDVEYVTWEQYLATKTPPPPPVKPHDPVEDDDMFISRYGSSLWVLVGGLDIQKISEGTVRALNQNHGVPIRDTPLPNHAIKALFALQDLRVAALRQELWSQEVRRPDGNVSVLQEIADIKTDLLDDEN